MLNYYILYFKLFIIILQNTSEFQIECSQICYIKTRSPISTLTSLLHIQHTTSEYALEYSIQNLIHSS